MKVLFASAAHSPDMSGSFLWDGLQTVLGPENVVDAMNGTALRGLEEGKWANSRPIRYFPEHRSLQRAEDDFDLLIATSTFLRDENWEWLAYQQTRLKKDGKTVWFDTLDGAADIVVPKVAVDAVFKREIDPSIQYPYPYRLKPLPLLCAMPERWLYDEKYGWTDQKEYDVFNVSNSVTTGWDTRWKSQAATFGTTKRRHNLVGAGVLQPNQQYLEVMRKFKLIVECPGGSGASDSGHFYETTAAGGITIFVDQQCRPRWPWFTVEHCFWCNRVEELAGVIDLALDNVDLAAMRLRLREHVLQYHTTEKRAKQFLLMVEKDAWHGTHGPWSW